MLMSDVDGGVDDGDDDGGGGGGGGGVRAEMYCMALAAHSFPGEAAEALSQVMKPAEV